MEALLTDESVEIVTVDEVPACLTRRKLTEIRTNTRCRKLRRRLKERKSVKAEFSSRKAASKDVTKMQAGPSLELQKRIMDNPNEINGFQTERGESLTNKRFCPWIGDIFHESFSPTLVSLYSMMNVLLTL